MTPQAILRNEAAREQPSAPQQPVYAFGRFRLYPTLRRLELDDSPVKIGARAFDLLQLLVRQAGETVSKRAIWDAVWSGLHVSDGNLRFQLVELRRILAAGGAGGAISAVPGRGYCFTTPLQHMPPDAAPQMSSSTAMRLPPQLEHMVGRQEDLAALKVLLAERRLVTIVGAGGIGKSTLAIAAAHEALAVHGRDIAFVDIGAVLDSALVISAIAAALDIVVQTSDPIRDITMRLAVRNTLLVIDSAEHVLDTVAIVVERLMREAPNLHLVVTSREALRIKGESVLWLEPFDEPTAEQSTSLVRLLQNPAAELLVERALAADSRLHFTDEDAPLIAGLCRQLDGVALAIELAAGRIPTHGLRGALDLLAGRIDHLRGGRRTAPTRHTSLRHTLTWSYDLLDPRTQLVLRRLSIFVGPFSLAAVCSVASGGEIDSATAAIALDDLASKSLVSVRRGSQVARFRLLDTTRAFLREQVAREEWPPLAARHAAYYSALLRHEEDPAGEGTAQAPTLEDLPNIRAALGWCYAQPGQDRAGTALAAGAGVLLQRLSLLTECQDVCETAIAALLPGEIGSRAELELQSCLAQSLMYTSGHTPKVLAAFERALELAANFGEVERQLEIINALHVFHNRSASFSQGLAVAEEGFRIAQAAAAVGSNALGHISLGIALHHVGRHREAIRHLEEAIALCERDSGLDRIASYATHPNRARVIVAQSLWLRGFPDQAAAMARDSIAEASALGHALSLAVALSGVPPVFIWRRDWEECERLLDLHWTLAEQNSLHPYRALVIGRRGELAVHAGRADLGVPMIGQALAELGALNYRLFSNPLRMTLAEGLAQLGECERALAEIDSCQRAVEPDGDMLYLPEVLRVKAEIVAELPDHEEKPASLLQRALAIARSQGALAWELRIATTSARLQRRGPKREEASALLMSVLRRFGEGGRTGDLVVAQKLLEN